MSYNLNIFLLEDDALLGSSLEDFLESYGHKITWLQDGQLAYETCYENTFDLLILDINVPSLDGISLLQNLRLHHVQTPTIFISSFKDIDKIKEAFRQGCDDYLKKPFELDELVLRIDTIIKRIGHNSNILTFEDGYTFNLATKQIFQNQTELSLAQKVIDLFYLLVKNKNQVVTKEMIIRTIWSLDEEYSEGSLRVYITRLKRIVGNDNLMNIKGIGYKLIIHE